MFFLLVFVQVANAQFSNHGIEVRGYINKRIIKRGGTGKAVVVLKIPEGLHTNSSRPKSEFLIPTTVKVKSENVRIGTVMYPQGKDKKFPFAEELLNIYDGQVKFYFIVSVPKNYRKKSVAISAVVEYQACTDEVCYPPKKQEVILTAKVR